MKAKIGEHNYKNTRKHTASKNEIGWDNEKYKPKLCKGICETTFKKRYANHKKYFTAERTRAIQNYLLNTGS